MKNLSNAEKRKAMSRLKIKNRLATINKKLVNLNKDLKKHEKDLAELTALSKIMKKRKGPLLNVNEKELRILKKHGIEIKKYPAKKGVTK